MPSKRSGNGEGSGNGDGNDGNGDTLNSVRHTDCVGSVEISIDCKQWLSALLAILAARADSAIPSSGLL